MATQEKFQGLISRIETILASYYGFEIELGAGDCLLPLTPDNPADPNADPTGTLFVTQDDELYLGLGFSKGAADHAVLFEGLAQTGTHTELKSKTIAALLVVIEEVSHFHLVSQRALLDLPTTRLELEWQAEIDKMIVLPNLIGTTGARVILRGLRHFLVNKFTLRTGLSDEESSRYEVATRFFDRAWRDELLPLMAAGPGAGIGTDFGTAMMNPKIKKRLREFYRMSWSSKASVLAA